MKKKEITLQEINEMFSVNFGKGIRENDFCYYGILTRGYPRSDLKVFLEFEKSIPIYTSDNVSFTHGNYVRYIEGINSFRTLDFEYEHEIEGCIVCHRTSKKW